MVIALSLLFVLALTASAWANPACAVCTVAVGASLEIARQLGVDDSVVGVWAGAMLAIIGFWTIRWFEKKGWNFKGRDWTLIIVSVAMIGFMYISEIKYTPQVIGIFYLDPFLFSTVLGALVMVWSSDFYQWMKARNGGHAHFPFEKVVLPIVFFAGREFVFNLFSDLRRRIEAVKKITVGFQTGGYFNGCLITFFSRQTMSL